MIGRKSHVDALRKAHEAAWDAIRETGAPHEGALWDAAQAIADAMSAAEDAYKNAQVVALEQALHRARKGALLTHDVCTVCTYGRVWDNGLGDYDNCAYCGGLGLVL